jgi:hypothetical protein
LPTSPVPSLLHSKNDVLQFSVHPACVCKKSGD